MKKIIFCALCVMIMFSVSAQQKPHYTQYILNQYIINPALTGIENYTDIKISHRHQWVGLQESPVTTYLTIQGPIGKTDENKTVFTQATPGVNPRGSNYWENYVTADPHHGWGLQVINDRTGPFNHFSAFGTYAYHIGLKPGTSLSAGIAAGVNNISLDASKLQFYTPVDPAVRGSGILNTLRFDMNAGLYLYSADYFVGLSALQIVPSKIDFSKNAVKEDGKIVPHIFMTAGYRFLLGETINFLPSVMVKYINPAPVQYELNAKLLYLDRLWFGGSIRFKDGISGMIGLNATPDFNVGYAYDYTTSRLNPYTKGTHEIMVGFILGNRYGDSCPRNVW